MSEKLGPGSYNFLQMAIDTLILQMNDIMFQRTENSETEQLMHKHGSYEISEIEAKYDPEIELVRNDMRNAEDKTSNEYFELMSELEEMQDARDREINTVENQMNDKEKEYEQQDSTLETRYNAAKSDREGLEQAQEQDIQRS